MPPPPRTALLTDKEPGSPFPTSFKEGVLHLQSSQPSLHPPQYPKATVTDKKSPPLRLLGVGPLSGVRGKGPSQGCPITHIYPQAYKIRGLGVRLSLPEG